MIIRWAISWFVYQWCHFTSWDGNLDCIHYVIFFQMFGLSKGLTTDKDILLWVLLQAIKNVLDFMEFIRKFDKKVFWCSTLRYKVVAPPSMWLLSKFHSDPYLSYIRNSVHRGVSTSVHAGIHTVPWADTPLLGRPPPDRHPLASVHAGIHKPPGQIPSLGRHRPGQTTPWADNPLGRHPLLGIHPLGIHPPGQTPPTQTSPVARHPCLVHGGIHPLSSALWDRHGYLCQRYASFWNAFLLFQARISNILH